MTLEQKRAMARTDAKVSESNAQLCTALDRAAQAERAATELYLAQEGAATPKQLERCLRRRFPRLDIRVDGFTGGSWRVTYSDPATSLPGVRPVAIFSVPLKLQEVSRYFLTYIYPNHTPLAAA